MNRLLSFLRLRSNCFEKVLKETSGRCSSIEAQVEAIGSKLCSHIENGKLTVETVICDSLAVCKFDSHRINEVYRSWLSLHMALGLSYKYNVTNKSLVRKILLELLKYSHGIDVGIFMRDLLHLTDLNATSDTAVWNKNIYFLQICAGFNVDLRKDGIKILTGPNQLVFSKFLTAGWCYYIDLPIGQPYLLDSHEVQHMAEPTTLILACENLKPDLVLLLLRHGASPKGRPLEYLLQTVGSVRILRTLLSFSSSPIELVHQSLIYCLRAVTGLRLHFHGQRINTASICSQERYYVSDDVIHYLPDDCYKTPGSLKHLSRCVVRECLLKSDNLPLGINDLIIPTSLKDYIDLIE